MLSLREHNQRKFVRDQIETRCPGIKLEPRYKEPASNGLSYGMVFVNQKAGQMPSNLYNFMSDVIWRKTSAESEEI